MQNAVLERNTPPQQLSRSSGRTVSGWDGVYYGSRQLAQSGHVPRTMYEDYERSATQRPQRPADDEGWQLPVPLQRHDIRTTTPVKDMLLNP